MGSLGGGNHNLCPGSSYHDAYVNNLRRVGGGMGWGDLWGFGIWVKSERLILFLFFLLPIPHVGNECVAGI